MESQENEEKYDELEPTLVSEEEEDVSAAIEDEITNDFDETADDETHDAALGSDDEEQDEITKEIEARKVAAETKAPNVSRPRSWLMIAFLVVFILIALDVAVMILGNRLFWSVRTVYVISLVVRILGLGIAAYVLFPRAYEFSTKKLYIIQSLIALKVGAAIAIVRVIMQPVFWTWINIIIEPIDSVLLAVGISYLLKKFITHKKI